MLNAFGPFDFETPQVSDKFMLYPGYEPPAPEPWPLVMHYGITYNVMHYAFDKHWYMSTDMTSCPGKRFQKPPDLDTLPVMKDSPEYRRMDVALSVGRGLYESSRMHAIEVCGAKGPSPSPLLLSLGAAAKALLLLSSK